MNRQAPYVTYLTSVVMIGVSIKILKDCYMLYDEGSSVKIHKMK